MSAPLLSACGLVEREDQGPRISWSFPALEADAATLSTAARLEQPLDSTPTFSWSRRNAQYYYFLARERRAGGDVVDSTVARFAIVTVSAAFNPGAHEALLRVMHAAFEQDDGSPMGMLQRVLSVQTKGSASAPPAADFVASRHARSREDADADAARWSCPEGVTPANPGDLDSYTAVQQNA